MTTTTTTTTTTLLSFWVFALLFIAAVEGLGSASTVAISHGTDTVCGIQSSTRTIVCVRGKETFYVLPNNSYSSISGGRDFFCGLRSWGNSLFCWNSKQTSRPLRPRRVYHGSDALQEINVGETQVSAVRNGTSIVWWRGRGEQFPPNADGEYKSLTSGNGFTCAIGANDDRVQCWGRIGPQMQSNFTNISMSTIAAGDAHACGIKTDGALICKGNNQSGQLGSQLDSLPFEVSDLALGEKHTCGIRRANCSVVCWGNGDGSWRNPIGSVSVVLIVAGGNLTCGVVSTNLSVICWGPIETGPPAIRPLPSTLPGLCRNENSCASGVFPQSQTLCSGSGVICSPCDAGGPPPQHPPPEEKTNKELLPFAIVGSVGSFVGICTFVYWMVKIFCKQKKVHNSVQPTIVGTSSGRSWSNSPPTSGPPVSRALSNSMKSRSKSSSFFQRQDSRMIRRQRSGPSSAVYADRPEEFTFEELEAATNNFASDAKIGGGSFGTVYRGKLPDGREVAIKRSETVNKAKKFQEKENAFQSELAFLSRLHHKHLVGFVGFCEYNDERLLVYEYMKNGALHDHLHSNNNGRTTTGLLNSWKLRIKILLDAARGIEYLHNYAVPHIIHRDIKSSNILLDANWTARVSDFGLSLFEPDSEETHLNVKAAGTIGYIDPEYYGLHYLTTKSDVYALGVVMLEVLTGKRAIFQDGEGTPTSVVEYVVPRMMASDGGRVEEVLDARVVGAGEMEAVELVAYTAMHCVRLEGKDRPGIADVVTNLETALAHCCDEILEISERETSDHSTNLVSID